MTSFERLGSTDPGAEAAAEKVKRDTLEDIKEEIGTDMYEEIIARLSTGDIDALTADQKDIITRIKQEKIGSTH